MAPDHRLKMKLQQLGLDSSTAPVEPKPAKQRVAAAAAPLRHAFTLFFPRPPYHGYQFKALKEKQGWNFTGLLLGMGGSTLRQLKQESGATILVANGGGHLNGMHPDPLDSTLHAQISSDSLANVHRAVDLIAKLMSPMEGPGFRPVKVTSGGSAVLELPVKPNAPGAAGKRSTSTTGSSSTAAKSSKHHTQAGVVAQVSLNNIKKRTTGIAARPAAGSSAAQLQPAVPATGVEVAPPAPSSDLHLQVGSPQQQTHQVPEWQQGDAAASSKDTMQAVPASKPPGSSNQTKDLSAMFANLDGFDYAKQPSDTSAPAPAAAAAPTASAAPSAETSLGSMAGDAFGMSPVDHTAAVSVSASVTAVQEEPGLRQHMLTAFHIQPSVPGSSCSAAPSPINAAAPQAYATSPEQYVHQPAAAAAAFHAVNGGQNASPWTGAQYHLFAGPPITIQLPWQPGAASAASMVTPSSFGGHLAASISTATNTTSSSSWLPPPAYGFQVPPPSGEHMSTLVHGPSPAALYAEQLQPNQHVDSDMSEAELIELMHLLDAGDSPRM